MKLKSMNNLSFDIISIVLFINFRFNTTWLYAECYTYRRLSQCMAISTELRDFDFFGGQKKDSFKDNLTAIEGKLIFWLSFGREYPKIFFAVPYNL